jgi:hypothetical protein
LCREGRGEQILVVNLGERPRHMRRSQMDLPLFGRIPRLDDSELSVGVVKGTKPEVISFGAKILVLELLEFAEEITDAGGSVENAAARYPTRAQGGRWLSAGIFAEILNCIEFREGRYLRSTAPLSSEFRT